MKFGAVTLPVAVIDPPAEIFAVVEILPVADIALAISVLVTVS